MSAPTAEERAEITRQALGCCNEYGCKRKQPIKVRKGWLTDEWFVITAYTSKDGGKFIQATSKHNITTDLTAALIDAGWTPPAEEPERLP